MDLKDKITEHDSPYDHLELMSARQVFTAINREDQRVALAVEAAIPQIEALALPAAQRMQRGGRLFYVGAGTSGRLGVLDASELPPTFGVDPSLAVGIIAGGDIALRHAVEHAEDSQAQGWADLSVHHPTPLDTVVGIAASGTTPYVIGAIAEARRQGLLTGCITSNPNTPLAQVAEHPILTLVGPEFVTGSSRMKSGTAQKMVLNMLSTFLMISLGRVRGNKMVNMRPTNDKLIDRGTRMILRACPTLTYHTAQGLLLAHGNVKCALEACQANKE